MIFDAVVVVIVLVSALIAFLRGLIRELLTIFGVAGGAAASYYLGPLVSPHARSWITPATAEGEEPQKFMDMLPYPVLGDVIAYGSVFVIFVIMLSVISHFLSGWAKSVGLGMADRLLGVLFGVARGLLLIAVLYLPVHMLVEKKERDKWGWIQESKTVPYIEKAVVQIEKFLPQEVEENIKDTKDMAEKTARETLQEIEASKIKERERKAAGGYDEGAREGLDSLIEDRLDDE